MKNKFKIKKLLNIIYIFLKLFFTLNTKIIIFLTYFNISILYLFIILTLNIWP